MEQAPPPSTLSLIASIVYVVLFSVGLLVFTVRALLLRRRRAPASFDRA